ncbi:MULTISPECIES: hypothetical protein [unclassified Thioclava]|uniref:hypothetical protein n=1 Tax=unclassified Thioclava TaxID=2621713 RepID=UPI000B5416DC|nr:MULTISPECIES: hypothetical protein [unclassified Thioclava]OWY07102.1 hypothetical protein B6V76_04880 [Thioclava sp. IC9]OWY12689.1 hypothetical protein B6V72_12450 [Thioclava sp. F34-6]
MAFAALVVTGVASSSFAGDLRETAPTSMPGQTGRSLYDPVAHALAIGLTPAMADARVDRAIKAVETCPLVFDTRNPIPGCWGGTVALGS